MKMSRPVARFLKTVALTGAMLVLPWRASSGQPLDYAGGSYTQNFDGLPTEVQNPVQTLLGKGPFGFAEVGATVPMPGWQFTNLNGSSANTEFRAHDGSPVNSAGRGVVSLGTNGSTERAVGTVITSNQVGGFGLVMTNNSTTTFNEFTVQFTGEQWRRGDDATLAPNKLLFTYGFTSDILQPGFASVPAADFAAPITTGTELIALDGNLPANRTAISTTVKNVVWFPGKTLVVRWAGQDFTGQDDGLALDDLTFSAAFNLLSGPTGPTFLAGDFNLDGKRSNLDIQEMLDAVADTVAYKTRRGLSDTNLLAIGDFDSSGAFDGGDVHGMLGLLAGNSGPQLVPEPASASLAILSLMAGAAVVRLRSRRQPDGE